jgi:chemotaxis protein CheC
MMNQIWSGFMPDSRLESLLQTAMEHAAHGLSDMVGGVITINVPKVESLPIGQIPDFAGDPETEIVGVYLLIEGDFTGQVILMLPLSEAHCLVDLLLDEPPGTTTCLGELERSALAEAGNLTASYFLNEIAALTKISSRPSPPAVIVDMLGTIVDLVTTPIALFSDTLLIAETVFQVSGQTVLAYFWVLPNPAEVSDQPTAVVQSGQG